jgi:membrane fusion protein (multidrug efflux system)
VALPGHLKLALGFLAVLAALGTVAVVTWQNRAPPPDAELVKEVVSDARPVEALELSPEPVTVTLEATGVLASRRDVMVPAEMGGIVRQVLRREGEPCRAGEVLARLDGEPWRIGRDQARALVDQAAVAHDSAVRDLERMKRLETGSAITPQQIDAAEAGVRAAAAALEQAKAGLRAAGRNLRVADIRCPFDGHLAERLVEVGQAVAPMSPVARLVDLEHLELTVAVAASRLGRLREGQDARLGEPGGRERPYAGVVERIGVAADPVTRAFPVVVALGPGQRGLRVGQVLAATFELARHDAALVVPADAVLDPEDAPAVLRVEGDLARRVAVDLGERVGDRFVVASGLAAGDRIVTAGGDGLADGARVRVLGAPSAAPSPPPAGDGSVPAAP